MSPKWQNAGIIEEDERYLDMPCECNAVLDAVVASEECIVKSIDAQGNVEILKACSALQSGSSQSLLKPRPQALRTG